MDLRGSVLTHIGNHPTLKLIQIRSSIQRRDFLLCCREDTMGILKYMMILKLNWETYKDLLSRLGWSTVDAVMMNPNPIEVPLGQLVQMNILT